jgi:hypothetical protein
MNDCLSWLFIARKQLDRHVASLYNILHYEVLPFPNISRIQFYLDLFFIMQMVLMHNLESLLSYLSTDGKQFLLTIKFSD